MSQDDYKKAINLDLNTYSKYYTKSINKTEQQKYLEKILTSKLEDLNSNYLIADIACGAGTLSYHLNNFFKHSTFTLVDYNEEALKLAKNLNQSINFNFSQDSIYDLSSLNDEHYNFVFCWQTLSWISEPEKALGELIRITKKGGTIYLSSLFNLNFDVDIYSSVFDYTLESGKANVPYSYNTYSEYSIKKWLNKFNVNINFYKFNPEIDFDYSGRGIGTFTVNSDIGRMQISANMLLNWYIMEIKKL